MNCERQIEITPKEAQTIIEAFKVWEGQGMSQPIWAIAESIHNKIESISEQEDNKETQLCTLCHVLEGDGSCCGCLEIQRDQGRYEGLWGDDQ